LIQRSNQWIAGDPRAIREFLLSGDLSAADKQSVDEFLASFSDMKQTSEPREAVRVTGDQGLIADPKTRKAVEDHAMSLAEAHYRELFDVVENTAATEPFDFRCKKGDEEVRVEVKGSTGNAIHVLVTAGEVENARGTGWRTDLFIVGGINVVPTENGPSAEGGTKRSIESWRPKCDELKPTVYRYTIPRHE
jgi:Domain of unknown function (DUF3883)